MKNQNCTYVQALLPESRAMPSEIKSQRDIAKYQCIYHHKPASFCKSNALIDRYIYFYNHGRIQLKTGEAQFKIDSPVGSIVFGNAGYYEAVYTKSELST